MSRPRLAFIVAACVSSLLTSVADSARAGDLGSIDRAQRAPRTDASGQGDLLPFTASDAVMRPGPAEDSPDAAASVTAREAQKSRANELVARGTDAALDARWIEAEALFSDAWALDKTYDIAGNLGHIELQNNKPLEAARHLRYCLDALPPSEGAEQRALTEARYEEARRQIAALSIKVSERGADVSIDGVSVGASPLEAEVLVAPGTHQVRATHAGFDATEQSVLVEKGASKGVTLTLFPVAEVQVKAPPIWVAPRAASGSSGEPPDETSRPASRIALIISGGFLTVTGLGVGTGLHIASAKLDEEAAKMRAVLDRKNGPEACYDEPALAKDCAELRAATTSGAAMSIGSKVAFGVGGVAAAGSIIYFVFGRSLHDPKTRTTVLPSVTANAGGLLLSSVW